MRFAGRLEELAGGLVEGLGGGAVQVPGDWRKEVGVEGRRRGGEWACVHLRRGDYARGRGSRAPTIPGAAGQVAAAMQARGLQVIHLHLNLFLHPHLR